MPRNSSSAVAGVGVGLRSAHYEHILTNRPGIPWFEATSENYMGIQGGTGGRPLEMLDRVRKDYPIILHGVSMNIGSADALRLDYLQHLKVLADRIQPVFVSDHLCWTGVNGENLHDLLPLPFTEETLTYLTDRVRQVQDILKRPLVLENVSSYLTFKQSTLTEWDFTRELATRTGCRVLLDVNNVYVSAINHGFNPLDFISAILREQVAYMHLAGYQDNGSFLIDTHDHPVSAPVWALYAEAVKRFGPVPTLIEWDEKIPSFETLEAEARRAAEIQQGVLVA